MTYLKNGARYREYVFVAITVDNNLRGSSLRELGEFLVSLLTRCSVGVPLEQGSSKCDGSEFREVSTNMTSTHPTSCIVAIMTTCLREHRQ